MFVVPQGSDALPSSVPRPPRVPAVMRSAHDSHVRLTPRALPFPPAAEVVLVEAQELLDELVEDQLTLSMDLARLEVATGEAPRDPSARAALRTLAVRVADLGALRDALANVHDATVDPRVQRVVVPDAPLADYLRGLYSWVHAIVRALDDLANSMRTLQPDWALVRWRIEEAKNFHFDELHAPIRADLFALDVIARGGSFGPHPPPIGELQDAVEHLFATAVALEEHLDERFG